MSRNRVRLASRAFALAAALLAATFEAGAYEPEVHQQLTFLAAKQLTRCGDAGTTQLSPLEVRRIANSNLGMADSNFFVRLFRWTYYDPLEREGTSIAWVLNTRFNDHFRELVRELDEADTTSARLREFGRIVSYIQLATSPARAIPVYAPRFWRWSFSDRFDAYPLQEAQIEALLAADCAHLRTSPASYEAILAETAADTLAAVKGPIGGLPATWESFWTLPDERGEFGEYGPAGNLFGRYAEFPCGATAIHRCVLITDDPAYVDFALGRQLAAVRATARAMLLFERTTAVGEEPDAPLRKREADAE
jgi:hypothetical protein